MAARGIVVAAQHQHRAFGRTVRAAIAALGLLPPGDGVAEYLDSREGARIGHALRDLIVENAWRAVPVEGRRCEVKRLDGFERGWSAIGGDGRRRRAVGVDRGRRNGCTGGEKQSGQAEDDRPDASLLLLALHGDGE